MMEMVSLEGFRPHLRDLLQRFDAPGLLSEAVWVAAYATASQQRHLPASEFLRPVLDLLEFAYSQPAGTPTSEVASSAPSQGGVLAYWYVAGDDLGGGGWSKTGRRTSEVRSSRTVNPPR